MTYPNTFSVAVLTLAFLVLSSEPAAAQEARSFEQLQLLVKPGDRIFVTDSMGNVTEGRIAGLSSSSLRLMTKSSTQDLSESDVFKIRQWRHDSLKNGALIGAGIGFGLSLAGVIAVCNGWGTCRGGEAVAAVAYTTGIVAAIGAGIDALIPSKETIYFGGTRTSLSRIKVKPILDHSRKGVAVAFSF